MKLADIGDVIVHPSWSSRVPDTQHTLALVPDCPQMTKNQFIAAYITTRTLGMLFPFRNNFTARFR
jgi:hypothetical protein